MKQVKCFFKIQIPVCDILKRYRGFFYAKNLKNWLVRVYIVKGKVPEKISEKVSEKT